MREVNTSRTSSFDMPTNRRRSRARMPHQIKPQITLKTRKPKKTLRRACLSMRYLPKNGALGAEHHDHHPEEGDPAVVEQRSLEDPAGGAKGMLGRPGRDGDGLSDR